MDPALLRVKRPIMMSIVSVGHSMSVLNTLSSGLGASTSVSLFPPCGFDMTVVMKSSSLSRCRQKFEQGEVITQLPGNQEIAPYMFSRHGSHPVHQAGIVEQMPDTECRALYGMDHIPRNSVHDLGGNAAEWVLDDAGRHHAQSCGAT